MPSIIRGQDEEFAYRAYVTGMLNGFMAGGKAPDWAEMVRPKPQDKRTPDEIAVDVITRAGIKLI